jgi:hypothetical protein
MKLKETIADVQQEVLLTQEDTDIVKDSLPKKSLSPTEEITNTIS